MFLIHRNFLINQVQGLYIEILTFFQPLDQSVISLGYMIFKFRLMKGNLSLSQLFLKVALHYSKDFQLCYFRGFHQAYQTL